MKDEDFNAVVNERLKEGINEASILLWQAMEDMENADHIEAYALHGRRKVWLDRYKRWVHRYRLFFNED